MQEIGKMLLFDIKDPRLRDVTITFVKISPDLSSAVVYFRRIGNAHSDEETSRGFASASGYLRAELGRKLYIHKVPELKFVADDLPERVEKIEKIFREISEQID
jgi:ribosome-binding factor A